MRHTTFTFKLQLDEEQQQLMRSHAGANRFAHNHSIAKFLTYPERKLEDPEYKGPCTGFDFINEFNQWKVSPEAGVDDTGKPGLPWRKEVLNHVFEEGCVDAGRSTTAFFKSIKAAKAAKEAGGKAVEIAVPRLKKKGACKNSFRIRNQKGCIRLGVSTIRLPFIGEIAVRGSTRKLRRMLRQPDASVPARAKILFVTITELAGVWHVRVNVEAAAFHPARFAEKDPDTAGVDLGLIDLAVVAHADGTQKKRYKAPKPLKRALKQLRGLSRSCARKQRGSRNHQRAKQRAAKLHHRIANVRHACLHDISSYLAKKHSHVSVEHLHIGGMLKNHCLARSISDAGWGMLSRQVACKSEWYGCQFTQVDRYYPSSKTCCRCGWRAPKMPLSERTFRCEACAWVADRDTNAAANLARWAEDRLGTSPLSRGTLTGCGGSDSVAGTELGSTRRRAKARPEAIKAARRQSRRRLTSEKDAVGAL